MTCEATRLLQVMQAEAAVTRERDALGRAMVRALRETFPQSSWAGIYWLESGELVLGPYEGPATGHTRIPVGRGVCGTAVAEDRDQRVEDVRTLDNYLACSATVRSELVVLIRAGDRVVGQFDLDAEAVGAFSEDDACVLRAVADAFGGLITPGEAAPPSPGV